MIGAFTHACRVLPAFYLDRIREALGPLWTWLPRGALYHDQNAYLASEQKQLSIPAGLAAAAESRKAAPASVAV